MSRHLEQLGKVIHDITPYVQERTPLSLGTNVHPYLPGDLVWVKDWEQQMLSCSARRPYQDYKLRIMCSCPGPTRMGTSVILELLGLWGHTFVGDRRTSLVGVSLAERGLQPPLVILETTTRNVSSFGNSQPVDSFLV